MLDPRIGKGIRLLGKPSFLRVYWQHRVVASLEHEALPDTSYATVVDIGAHTGQFTLLARARYPEAMIHAFEPLPEAAAKFREVFEEDPRVQLHEAAIAPEARQATLYLGRAFDGGSLLPNPRGRREVSVRAAPLADLLAPDEIRPPALLKLDVQGFEYEALAGCRSLLDKFDDVMAELSLVKDRAGQRLASDVISLLRDEGFQFTGMDAIGRRKGKITSFDGIFSRVG